MSMFHLLLAGSTSYPVWPPLLPIVAFVALMAVTALGVFRPRKILGPPRLSPGESPRILIGGIGFAMAAWCFAILAADICHQWVLKRHGQTQSAPLSDAETVVYPAAIDLAVLIGIFAFTLTRPQGFRRMGINLSRLPRGLLGGLLAIVLVLPLIFYVDALTQAALNRLHRSPPPHVLLEILVHHPAAWLRVADVLSACIIAPVVEEIFFRGLLQTALRYILNRPWPAVFFAALIFALFHRWWTWPQIFFLGICLGYVYERTGNLWVSIGLHAMFNITSMWLFVHFG